MSEARILIANRGEVAMRIVRSARDLSMPSVSVFTADDAGSMHVTRADEAYQLPGQGVAGYLDIAAVVEAAKATRCSMVHPGYGLLAESAAFAAAVEAAGLKFVGPGSRQLDLFGDKIKARQFAADNDVPTLPASHAGNNIDELLEFIKQQQPATVVVKAAAGGGGRGMRVVRQFADATRLINDAAQEASAAFGDGRVYAERFVARARHIEVQILGHPDGQVMHLGERDCTCQRRHQKLIEITPAPGLDDGLRQRMTDAACRLAERAGYHGLGTVEFLLDLDSGEFFFIEANARLQVEHTVTETVYGLDLVAIQLQIACGKSMAEIGLEQMPERRGQAMQLRINAETMLPGGDVSAASGQLTRFDPPAGPGIRIDTAASLGYAPHPAFDSLLAKLIVATPADDFDTLVLRTQRAAQEFAAAGLPTNLPFLRAILAHPAFADYALTTEFINETSDELIKQAPVDEWDAPGDSQQSSGAAVALTLPNGCVAIAAPMRGSVIELLAATGTAVKRGQTVVLLEAMKMHHDVVAPADGLVREIVVRIGDVVDAEACLVIFEPAAGQSAENGAADELDLDASRADLDEVIARHTLGEDSARPQAVAKRRKFGSRTARENVADLIDDNSFIEYGALAIAAQRRRRTLDDLHANTPADGMIAGFGTVNAGEFGTDATRCAVLAYDFTVLAGTQGHHNHKKKDRLFELAEEWKTPVVFFTEGGGGRPGDVDTDDIFMSWLDLKTFATWPRLSGLAPRIAINSGRCFAGNAVIFGCADITIATENSNIGLAGPAMIEGGGLGRYTPEDIGPIGVQTENGVVDIACADEAEATAIGRKLLGCFQGRLKHYESADQRRLRHLIPEDRLRVYDIRAVIETLADTGSVIELRRDYGVGLITALVRVEGYAFGLIANDPRHLGGAIDGDGGEKGGRFLQLCDTYGLPVISLCDTPGYMVGPDSEKTAAVRRGSRLIVASANLSVPFFTIVIRKGYGLGAQAMAGGSFHQPFFNIAWPTAEMGPMGLEGAVELGFKKELEATPDAASRQALFEKLVGQMYTKGKAVSVASVFEIDAVIDPAETRQWLVRGLKAAGNSKRKPRRYIDVW